MLGVVCFLFSIETRFATYFSTFLFAPMLIPRSTNHSLFDRKQSLKVPCLDRNGRKNIRCIVEKLVGEWLKF